MTPENKLICLQRLLLKQILTNFIFDLITKYEIRRVNQLIVHCINTQYPWLNLNTIKNNGSKVIRS